MLIWASVIFSFFCWYSLAIFYQYGIIVKNFLCEVLIMKLTLTEKAKSLGIRQDIRHDPDLFLSCEIKAETALAQQCLPFGFIKLGTVLQQPQIQ